MAEAQGLIGGFVAANNGEIENCYCVTRFNGKKYTSGGFVGENKGDISQSFCEYSASGLEGGFSGTKGKLGEGCFFVHDLDPNSRKIEPLWDNTHGLRSEKIKNERDAAKAGFDIKNIWSYTGKKPLLKFKDDTWMFENAFRSNATKQILSIKDAKNLFLFAEMVNNGDKRFVNAKVRLDADIDLKGKTWIPIGLDRGCAFCGVFDGNGHTVKNFIIKGNSYSRKGFFGFLKGEVFNLTLDCEIRGEGYLGSIAAINEGTIGCCGATVGFYGKGADVSAGGLVGINNGRIFQSYAAGKIKFLLLPIIPIAVVASSAVVISAAAFSSAAGGGGSVYHPVDTDPNQQQIVEVTPADGNRPSDTQVIEVTPSNTEAESSSPMHSFGFTFNQEIDITLSSKDCLIDFSNPVDNSNNMVVELSIENSDGELIQIAKSGAVEPGYMVRSLTLSDNVTIATGEYSGYVHLIGYDTVTHDRAFIESELPVYIKVSK